VASSEELEAFIKSFRSLGKSLSVEDIDIRLNLQTEDWDTFIESAEKAINDFSSTDKKKEQLIKLLDKLKNSSSKVKSEIEYIIKDLLLTFKRRPDANFEPVKERIEQVFYAVNKLEEILFERSRLSPASIPDCESQLKQVEVVRGMLAGLGVKTLEDLDSISVASLDDNIVRLLFKEANKIESLAVEVIKTDRVYKEAVEQLFKQRGTFYSLRSTVSAFNDVKNSFTSIQDSGDGLNSAIGTIWGIASRALTSAAVSIERRRLLQSKVSVDPEKEAKNAFELDNRLSKIGSAMTSGFKSMVKSINSIGKSVGYLSFILDLMLKGMNYTAEVNKSIIELFGTQELLYGIEPNSENLFKRIDSLNKQLNSVQDEFLLDYTDRVKGILAYREAGGSTKNLEISSAKDFGDPENTRNIFSPIALSAKYGHLLGMSFEEVMSKVGNLTFSSQLTTSQVEQVFEEARVGAYKSRTNTSLALNSLIEISQKFGGVINTFTINSSILTKIANSTKLNESQAADFVSSVLDNVKSQRFEDMGTLITLAGYDLDSSTDLSLLRQRMREGYLAVRKSLEAQRIDIGNRLGTQSNEYLQVQIQLSSLGFYEAQLSNPDIMLTLLESAKVFPQVVLPVFQQAIDGQIKLIYGIEADRVMINALSYRSALDLASKQINIPEQFKDLLLAARFDPNGIRKLDDRGLFKLESSLPQAQDHRKNMTDIAARMAKHTTSGVKTLNQAKNSIFAGIGSLFRRAQSLLSKATSWIQSVISAISRGQTPVIAGAIAGAAIAGGAIFGLTTLGIGPIALAAGAGLLAGGSAGLGIDRMLNISQAPLDSASLYRSKMSLNQSSEETKLAKKLLLDTASDQRIYGPLMAVAAEYNISPALLFALKIQATGTNVRANSDKNARHLPKGVFQLIPEQWKARKEQCMDIISSARLVAERAASNIQKIVRISKERNLNLGEGDILSLAAAMHLAPDLVEDVLRNRSGRYRAGNRDISFSPNLPEGSSADKVTNQIDRAMHVLYGISMGEKTPYDQVKDKIAVGLGLSEISGTGSNIPRTADNISDGLVRQANLPTGKLNLPRLDSQFTAGNPATYRVSTQKVKSSRLPRLAPRIEVGTGRITDSSFGKKDDVSVPQFILEQLPDTRDGRKFRYIVTPKQDVTPPSNQVFYKNVLYETLYLNDANNLIRVWERLVGNSGT